MYQMPFPSLPMYWIVPAVRDLMMVPLSALPGSGL